ncbi:chymotrypsinogen A-like [Sabethes cyaneus]|uniref:chymotrypsinogen A-like n=1 Tax=Sabethes cyaneus TaxID=53552 RepID=UPI00237D4A67|nr:chymotrypsinogen A-like [Sabethes cyaneus]
MKVKKSIIVLLSTVLVVVCCNGNILPECGIPQIGGNELITNGKDTAPGDWPWHAAIYHRKGSSTNYACGGTIISENFIVTAAHCVMNAANGFQLALNRIFVRLGIHDLYVINPEFIQQHEVGKIFKFANFTRFANDIALLKLSTIIRFTNYVLPACINVEPNITGEFGTVIGWGLMETEEMSPVLKMVDLPVIEPVACLKTDRVLFGQTLDDGLFCAGYTNGTGVCNGDSGGGLFFRRTNTWFLGGIVSFSQLRPDGSNKCFTKGYGVFTKVQHYISWISEITGMSFQRNNVPRKCKAVEPIQTNMSSKLLPRHCGVYVPNRIMGGVVAQVFEFPWMALLMDARKEFMCHGTLISRRYILTTADCFAYSLPEKVRLGEHTINKDIDCNNRDEDCAPPVRDYDIECFTVHSKFSLRSVSGADDIALVRLSEDVRFDGIV